MVEITQLILAADRLMNTDRVVTVFITSRAGIYVFGETPRTTDRSMYSAITSMMLGAAEQMANEMDEILDYVLLCMSEYKLIVMGGGPKHLIGILTDAKVDPDKMVKAARTILNDVMV